MAKAKTTTRKRTTKRPAKATAKRPTKRATKRSTKRAPGSRASFEAKAAAAGRMNGPSIPLRDLIRGGMPRSPKARGGATAGAVSAGPLARRRMKSAYGTKTAGGTTLMQFDPAPLTHIGTQRAPIRKG